MDLKHCGTCKFAEPIPNNLQFISCYGAPPVPVMTPVQTPQGVQMQMQNLRPGLARSEHACSLHQDKELEAANGPAADME